MSSLSCNNQSNPVRLTLLPFRARLHKGGDQGRERDEQAGKRLAPDVCWMLKSELNTTLRGFPETHHTVKPSALTFSVEDVVTVALLSLKLVTALLLPPLGCAPGPPQNQLTELTADR